MIEEYRDLFPQMLNFVSLLALKLSNRDKSFPGYLANVIDVKELSIGSLLNISLVFSSP